MFQPLSLEETHRHILECAAKAAAIKGLADADWYTEEEVLGFLEREHPKTFRIFNEFSEAYFAWSKLNYASNQARVEGKLSPLDAKDLERLGEVRDSSRKAILTHLKPGG